MMRPRIELMVEAESTNDLALSAIADGEPEGTVFVADRQTSGRGRRDVKGGRRQWFSPAGKNLYLSVVIRPKIEMERLAAITLAVGVAIVEVLREKTGVDIWLKWPNDLYVGDRKLGGILTEGSMGTGGIDGAAVGLGLNVNVVEGDLPEELRPIATSLRRESGTVHDRLDLTLAVSGAIVDASGEYALHGLEAFGDRLARYDGLTGRAVEVLKADAPRPGMARGIGESGGLLVEYEDGTTEEVISGEVVVPGLGRGFSKGQNGN